MLDAQPTKTTLLEVNNIEVIYNHVILVLKGVSLNVKKGGITALLGGNGAGKTTTLKAISNLLKSERGEVTYESEHMTLNLYRARALAAATLPGGAVFDPAFGSYHEDLDLGLRDPLHAEPLQGVPAAPQVRDRPKVHGEPADQCPPFGIHVRGGHSLGHAE